MPHRDTKRRMVDGAIALLRERGANAVTLDAVLRATGTPRGSVYHHFPGGRDELLLDAARTSASYISSLLDRAADDAESPAALVDAFVAFWSEVLRTTDYRAGCPVAALTVDGRDDLPGAAALVEETYARWTARIAEVLRDFGCDPAVADERATFALASVEGAVLMCRAQRSIAPLEQVSRQLQSLL